MQITPLFIEHRVHLARKVLHLVTRCLLLSRRLQFAEEVPIFVQVVAYRVVREALNALLHDQVLVDVHLEAALHLLVIDLVLLPDELLLLQVDDVGDFRDRVQFKTLVHFVFNQLHFLHHEGFRALTALHILNALLLDTIQYFLLCGLVDVVKDLKFGPLRVRPLPLVDISRVERFVIVDKILQVCSCDRHF